MRISEYRDYRGWQLPEKTVYDQYLFGGCVSFWRLVPGTKRKTRAEEVSYPVGSPAFGGPAVSHVLAGLLALTAGAASQHNDSVLYRIV